MCTLLFSERLWGGYERFSDCLDVFPLQAVDQCIRPIFGDLDVSACYRRGSSRISGEQHIAYVVTNETLFT